MVSDLLRWTFFLVWAFWGLYNGATSESSLTIVGAMGGKHTGRLAGMERIGLRFGINGIATTGDRATGRLVNRALVTIRERENTDGLAWTERGRTTTDGRSHGRRRCR